MNEKELKNLSRQNLLELLIAQTHRADELQNRVTMLEQIISKREAVENESATIADVAIKVNGVIEAAQNAADQYLDNVKRLSDEKQNELRDIEEYRRTRMFETDELCRRRELKTEEYVSTVSARVQELFSRYRTMEDDITRIMMDSNRG